MSKPSPHQVTFTRGDLEVLAGREEGTFFLELHVLSTDRRVRVHNTPGQPFPDPQGSGTFTLLVDGGPPMPMTLVEGTLHGDKDAPFEDKSLAEIDAPLRQLADELPEGLRNPQAMLVEDSAFTSCLAEDIGIGGGAGAVVGFIGGAAVGFGGGAIPGAAAGATVGAGVGFLAGLVTC